MMSSTDSFSVSDSFSSSPNGQNHKSSLQESGSYASNRIIEY